MKERLPLLLVLSIPAAAILMGAISLYFAYQGPNPEIQVEKPPLTKTSFRRAEADDDH
ncbi:MAG: hypothetical protein PVF57_03730 [Pseudomonadales bacterium]|jgi:hypothetical protein